MDKFWQISFSKGSLLYCKNRPYLLSNFWSNQKKNLELQERKIKKEKLNLEELDTETAKGDEMQEYNGENTMMNYEKVSPMKNVETRLALTFLQVGFEIYFTPS